MIKLLLAAALLTPTTQVAPPRPCLDRADVNEVTLFLLPLALDGLAEKCRAALPANAYLLTGGRALSTRVAAASSTHWQGARAAFEKISGEKVLKSVSEATMTQLFRELAKGELIDKLKPADCSDVNEAAELLAPLPPENLGGLVRLLMRAANANPEPGKKDDIRICPTPAS